MGKVSEITSEIRDLEALLVYPREDLDCEIKGWLDIRGDELTQKENQADLAKAIIAIANHGGGYVIIGYDKHLHPIKQRPDTLEMYNQDAINSIVHNYAQPSFHCRVFNVVHPELQEQFPIVIVPGGHKRPIITRKQGPKHIQQHKYYIRKQGPKSEEPHNAHEWDELIDRCIKFSRDEYIEEFRAILYRAIEMPVSKPLDISSKKIKEDNTIKLNEHIEASQARWISLIKELLPKEKPSRYAAGFWFLAYQFHKAPNKPLTDLRNEIRECELPYTGWPMWLSSLTDQDNKPKIIDKHIEAFIWNTKFVDGVHSDFWRASKDGSLFLTRGYEDDGRHGKYPVGTSFDYILPIWRVGECLMHANTLSQKLFIEPIDITFKFKWHKLGNRCLKSWVTSRYWSIERCCHQKTPIESELTVQSDKIELHLPELVKQATENLYEAFDGFSMPLQVIQEELVMMLKRTR